MSEDKDFEMDPLQDRKPVELLENRSDVVVGAGVRNQAETVSSVVASSCTCHVLEIIKFAHEHVLTHLRLFR